MYTIYGKPGCAFCVRAMRLLERHHIEYKYVNISEDENAKQYITEELQARTLPQIFSSEGGLFEHVGGYDQLAKRLS